MAEDYLDPLQGIVRQTIREELSRLEPRFQRITMSQDTDGHPAELYGAGGKIYYRKEGGVGAELGTGDEGDARYVRKDAGAGTQNMRNDLHFINYQVLEFFDNAPTLHGDISVDVSDNFVVRSNNSSVLTLISAAGYIACSGDRLSDVGTPVVSGDAVKVDANIHVPLAQLPLTSKGTVFAGNGTAAGVLAIGTNDYVLTLDSTAALGVKWAVGAGVTAHSALTQLDFASSGHTGNLPMGGYSITGFDGLAFDTAEPLPDIIFDTGDSLRYNCTTNTYEFLIGSALKASLSATVFDLGVSLDMSSNQITGLVTPTADGNAARKKYVDDAVAAVGGTFDHAALTSNLGFASSGHTGNLPMGGYSITGFDGLAFDTAEPLPDIIFDTGDSLRYNCTTNTYEFLIGSALKASLSATVFDLGVSLDMSSNQITGLVTPTADGNAARKKYVDDAVAAVGGTFDHAALTSNLGFASSGHTGNLPMGGYSITGFDGLAFDTAEPLPDIIFDTGDSLRYNCTTNTYEFLIGSALKASLSATVFDLGVSLDMSSNQITGLVTPTADGNAARKKYVDDAVAAVGGTFDHAALTSNLGFASSGHTGNLPMGGYSITGFDGLAFDTAEPLPDIIFDTGDSLRYNCTTNTYEFLIGSALKASLSATVFDLGVSLDMSSNQITGLVTPTADGNAARKKYVDDAVAAVGGTFDHAALTSNLGFASSGHTGNLPMGGYSITGFDGLAFDTAEPLPDIIFDTGDSLRYNCTTNTYEFLIGSALKASLSATVFDLGVSLDMSSNQITGLVTPTADGNAARKKYVDDAVAAVGGTFDHAALTSNLGFASSGHTGNLPMGGYSITGFDGLAFDTAEPLPDIIFDTGDSLRYNCTTNTYEFLIGSALKASLSATVFDLGVNLDMSSNDILNCKDIKGLTTGTDGANRLALDFRGDANHRIYYTGIADNKLQYKTFLSHEFMIQSGLVLEVKSGGIELSGSIKLDGSTGTVKIEENDGTGDMEFTVASGDAFVFKTV